MSTAKSMAAQYLSAKRSQQQPAGRFKSSTSNLATATSGLAPAAAKQRPKATSMTNLAAPEPLGRSRIQRPASRNALDSIHMGMNAKYAQVQSKVLLQNIRPQSSAAMSSSKIPARAAARKAPAAASPTRASGSPFTSSTAPAATTRIQQSERSQLINKMKALQEEVGRQEQLREELRQELERERADKTGEVQRMKAELEEKVAEMERQGEDYHQKLLEAYELADQNRRAADGLLNESRQRDEEARKRIEELEQQLAELKEFVAMKEEMASKMGELREQIREERDRYEEKTRSLNQMFENEKVR